LIGILILNDSTRKMSIFRILNLSLEFVSIQKFMQKMLEVYILSIPIIPIKTAKKHHVEPNASLAVIVKKLLIKFDKDLFFIFWTFDFIKI